MAVGYGPLPIGLVGVMPWLALADYLLTRIDDGAGLSLSRCGSPSPPAADE